MAVERKGGSLADVLKNIGALTKSDVLVGIPGESAGRAGGGPNNAELAYIHSTGSPANNIPARPFLGPGIEVAEDTIVAGLKAAGKAALRGDAAGIVRGQRQAGFAAENAAKKQILDGLDPALSERTLCERADRRTESGKASTANPSKEARKELASRKAGNAPSSSDARPLLDSRSLFTSITHVIRPRGS